MLSLLNKNEKNKKTLKNSKKRAINRSRNKNKNRKSKKLKYGGATLNKKMIIQYGNITLDSQNNPNRDLTEEYNTNLLNKQPNITLQDFDTELDKGKNYLLTLTDPDAMGNTWTHWVALLDANGKIIKHYVEYEGPSPPSNSGVHHYTFQLYDASTLTISSSTLDKISRGDYFALRLNPILEEKQVLAKVVFTIDSSKIKELKKKKELAVQ